MCMACDDDHAECAFGRGGKTMAPRTPREAGKGKELHTLV
jgi:hypothetical protein